MAMAEEMGIRRFFKMSLSFPGRPKPCKVTPMGEYRVNLDIYTDMDCHLRVCAGGDHQKRTEHRTQHERNPANSQRQPFREYAHFAGSFATFDQDGK
ncbi:MAG: hypothetical protein HZA50_08780 [Planctomycetes bacterium]|nr:hypothetical protein [Planctomycetota bacterium]